MIKDAEDEISEFTWREKLQVDVWAEKFKKESKALISRDIKEKQRTADKFMQQGEAAKKEQQSRQEDFDAQEAKEINATRKRNLRVKS